MADDAKTDAPTPQEVELIRQVYAHPEARKYIEEAIHIKYPQADLPGRAQRVVIAEVDKKLKERETVLDTKIADFEKKRESEQTEQSLREAGYTPDQIGGITKLMKDEGLNVANASVVYQHRSYVAKPRTPLTNVGSSVAPGVFNKGAWADHFRGIMDGDFHTPGQEWAHALGAQILDDIANGQGKKWDDPTYWPASPLAAPVKA